MQYNTATATGKDVQEVSSKQAHRVVFTSVYFKCYKVEYGLHVLENSSAAWGEQCEIESILPER